MKPSKLGILLSTGPNHSSSNIVAKLCSEAVTQQVDVYLYLIDEGVKNIQEPLYSHLVDKGIKMFVCAYGCRQHRVPTEGLDTRVSLCGLVVLANLMKGCDRFISFT
jgi:sulfur relay (sulfurtransferase) complex TusBCD TusD component (DsrE family)